jgi:peptide chain release factor 1
MFERLNLIEARYAELELLLQDPAVVGNQTQFQSLAKELARISDIVKIYRQYKKNKEDHASTELLLSEEKDAEMSALYAEELEKCEALNTKLRDRLEELLLDEDDEDRDRNIIVEIRAGTGGEEAALFASVLFRMYTKYADAHKLKYEVMSTNPTGIGGLKEIIFAVSGENAYKYFRFESGTHRVQRVPVTETSGRIHTSAVTVAVLPEAEDVDVQIEAKDLRIDVYRSSGPGGQSVNTTDSAVRITHDPTGIVVTCQDEKSQHKNKAKAMRVLRARLYERIKQEQENEIAQDRKQQVGTGDRSGRIRTYNFPDRRVTDHRVNVTLYSLERFVEGEIDEIVEALEKDERTRRLQGISKKK